MWVLQCSIYVSIIDLLQVNKVLGLEDVVLKKPLYLFIYFMLPSLPLLFE